MTDLSLRVDLDLTPREVELERQVRALLVRIRIDEQLATEAGRGTGQFYAWPSWSMDTGLTEAQERFVEAWSPSRVLAALQAERRMISELLRWTRVHRDDAHVDEALTILASLGLR